MFLTLINRIYLSDLSSLVNRKDKRSIRIWCIKNHLEIYKDSSGEYVNEKEFELVYNMPIIIKLSAKYGESWEGYYDAYKNEELYKILDFETAKTEKKGYEPKGKLSSKIFGRSLK